MYDYQLFYFCNTYIKDMSCGARTFCYISNSQATTAGVESTISSSRNRVDIDSPISPPPTPFF